MFGSSQVTSWDAWGMQSGDHESPSYRIGVRQLKEWHERCRLKREQKHHIGQPGYCKDCGKKLHKSNTLGWCLSCKQMHEAEIRAERRAKISQKMKRTWESRKESK